MTNKERSAAIRAEIKKLGYNSRQVSVRSRKCGYSDETSIEVKDLSCDIKAIEKACMKFESIDYDQYSGEILSGGNTYISVTYDYDTISKATSENLEKAEKTIKEIDCSCVLFENEMKRIVLCRQDDMYGIAVYENGENFGTIKVPFCFADRMKWTVARMFATNFAEVA